MLIHLSSKLAELFANFGIMQKKVKKISQIIIDDIFVFYLFLFYDESQ